jgi:threonine dehydrogenase-like Zn-dependent dehydrogenase
MKLVRVHAPGRYAIDDVATPQAGPNDAIVRVVSCGVCGSDVHFVRGGVLQPNGEPMPLGHEAAGIVERVGEAVRGVTTGMRVFINPMGDPGNVIGNGGSEGAFAREVLVRDAVLGETLLPVPDAVPLAHAALVEPLAVGLHGVNRGKPTPQSRVAVFGCGPIGLGAILWLARMGLRDIVAIDVSEERLAFARKMGAHVTINPMREDLRERLLAVHGAGRPALGQETVGTDIFYDMAGGRTVIPNIVGMAQFQARLVVTAVYLEPVPIDMTQILARELEMTGAVGYPTELHDVLQALPDIDPAVLDAYISHRFPFERFDEAFEVAQQSASAKVMIEFA